ncbi:hypothetical protein GCM10017577_02720 [Pseudonocardia halophobica]|uniref:JmjC domain-containing protein n=1 Tax=Pseudonocardia halophobica TaxID=29401 RepID=A0A9W6NUB5_9PSEU|nr:cupin domain-containing protein [Pseudonocardia halophobica]GLL09132.1 hypothetical protein GCM10017577_02720 [Pseudonocardia halophobica]
MKFASDGRIFSAGLLDQQKEARTPEAFHEELRSGSTLIIDSFEKLHRPVADVCRFTAAFLHADVDANLFASTTTNAGFATHWDDHDVFVLQVQGSKLWRIYEPTRRSPLDRDVEVNRPPAATARFSELLLRQGDLLYLPRGYWHNVQCPEGEQSLHLTLSARFANGLDFLQWLIDRLRAFEELRADITTSFGDTVYLARVWEIVSDALADKKLLQDFREFKDNQSPPFSLARQPEDGLDTPIRALTSRRQSFTWLAPRARIVPTVTSVKVITNMQMLTFSVRALPILLGLTGRQWWRLDSLLDLGKNAGASEEDVVQMLRALLEVGVVGMLASDEVGFAH